MGRIWTGSRSYPPETDPDPHPQGPKFEDPDPVKRIWIHRVQDPLSSLSITLLDGLSKKPNQHPKNTPRRCYLGHGLKCFCKDWTTIDKHRYRWLGEKERLQCIMDGTGVAGGSGLWRRQLWW